jgi:excisionase family DNA binding protein
MGGERDEVLTTFQAAAYCNVSPFTVRNWVESGILPAYRTPGGHRRILKADLDEFLEKYRMPKGKLAGRERKKVLVVDDQREVAEFVRRVVREVDQAAEVAIASDGFEAGYLLKSFVPSVVLLDLRMPGLDGFEVCKKIKANAATADAVVIGITGYYSPEYDRRFSRCGGWRLLAKPLDVVHLKRAITEAFQMTRAKSAASQPGKE